MGVLFLNNIDVSNNELQNVKFQVTGSAPTAAQGQFYYNSSDKVAKYHTDTDWVNISDTTLVSGVFISANASSGSKSDKEYTPNLSATGLSTTTPSEQFLRGDNTWATPPGIDPSGIYLPLSAGSTQALTNSLYIEGVKNTPIVNLKSTTNNASWTVGDKLGGVNFSSADVSGAGAGVKGSISYIVTTTSGGDASMVFKTASSTANDVLALTLDSSQNATFTENVTVQGDIDATNLSGTNTGDEVTLSGDVAGVFNAGDVITTIQPGAVDFDMVNVAAVIVSGEGIANNDVDTAFPTSKAVKSYVDSSIVGQLVYQGGYDANGNSPKLDDRNTDVQIGVLRGWTYTVTTAGTFYGEVVRVGDLIIAEDNLTAGNGALADWTTVQNNIDVANGTTPGIGNVVEDATSEFKGIDVEYDTSGTATVGLRIGEMQALTSFSDLEEVFIPVQDIDLGTDGEQGKAKLSDIKNAINATSGRKILLSDAGTGVVSAFAGGVTTFTITLATAWSLGIVGSDVQVETIITTTSQTVYPVVTRTASAIVISIISTAIVADGVYTVLLNNVG